ncbi:MAG TPA: OB-fold domain-containing protein [Steroidobacteraceae bacterium]|nr:OB-fold domain-containing protein [Steroidobacteraceae bacterium]
MNTQPVAPRLFATSPALRLLAGRHRDSGRLVFPLPPDRDSYATVELPERGTLWSYTVQRFAPKSPPYRGTEPFSPFALGYIDLPGALIVESRLTDVEFDQLRVGQAMELTTMPLRVEPDGTVITIYAFRPAQGQRS